MFILNSAMSLHFALGTRNKPLCFRDKQLQGQ